jgi:diguanylate cyclase (GGDEF)-like protein/PAS domain S-box-containing protein
MLYTPHILPLIVASILLVGIGFYTIRFENSPVALPIRLEMWLGALWALSYALAISVNSLSPRIFLGNCVILFALGTTFMSLVVVFEYTGRGRWLANWGMKSLLVLIAVITILAFTSPYHQLFRYDFQIDLSNHFVSLHFMTGPLYVLYAGYVLLVDLTACVLLILSALRQGKDYLNTLLILLSILFPFVAGVLFLTGKSPVKGFDLSSTMLVFSGFLMLGALFVGQFLDVVHIARDRVMKNIEDLVIVQDIREHIVDLNPAAESMLGLSDQRYVGITPNALPDPWADLFRRFSVNSLKPQEVVVDFGSGQGVYDLTITPILDDRARHLGRLILLHNITERKYFEESLRESEKMFRLMIETTVAALYIYDGERLLVVNPAFRQITGYSDGELEGIDPLDLIHPDYRAEIGKRAFSRLKGERSSERYEVKILTHGGGEKWVDMSVGAITYRGKPAILGTFLDITESKIAEEAAQRVNEELSAQLEKTRSLQEQLYEQAVRDELTGLFNRRYMQETLTREVASAERGRFPISIIMLDLDFFKALNDTHGHKAGDLILHAVGQILREHIRQMDVACRFGGEEFVIIMPTTPLETGYKRAEFLRQSVEKLSVAYKDQALRTTISAGVAAFPLHGSDGDAVLHAADKALYAAKTAGRNRVMVCCE